MINLISAQAYTLKVTEEHPFLMNGEWITALQLKVGDSLTTADGKKAKITEIEDIALEDEGVDVYNLEALPFNDFVVDGEVVVHNSNSITPLCYRFFNIPESDIIEALRIAERNLEPAMIPSNKAFENFRTLNRNLNPFSVLSGMEEAEQIAILKKLLSQGKFFSMAKFRTLSPSRRDFYEAFLENAILGQEGISGKKYSNREFGILEALLLTRDKKLEIVFLPKIGEENRICLDTSLLISKMISGARVIFARTIHTHLVKELVSRKTILSPNDQLATIDETLRNDNLAAQCSVVSSCGNLNPPSPLLLQSPIFLNPSDISGPNANEIPLLIRGAERVLNEAETGIDTLNFFENFNSNAQQGLFSEVPLPNGINTLEDVINLGR